MYGSFSCIECGTKCNNFHGAVLMNWAVCKNTQKITKLNSTMVLNILPFTSQNLHLLSVLSGMQYIPVIVIGK
jgi:hypothetical protein